MIKVQDWIASIPDEEKHIAYVGEGKSEQRTFLLCGEGWETYKAFSFHLDMAFDPTSITTRDTRQVVQTTFNSSESKEEAGKTVDEITKKETYTVENINRTNHNLTDISPLSKTVTDDGILLTWNILRQHTVLPGKLWATIRALDNPTQRIKKSAIMTFEVDPAICAVSAAVPPVSEYDQMIAQMDTLREQTAAAAEEAISASNDARSALQQIEQAADTSRDNADAASASAAQAQTAAQTTATHVNEAARHYQLTVNEAHSAVEACTDANEFMQSAADHAASAAISAQGAHTNYKNALAAVDQCSRYTQRCENAVEDIEKSLTTLNHRRVNVRDYGAVGDGVTDDRQAIIRAFAAAKTMLPCEVYFPAGTYGISNGITVEMAYGTGGLVVRGAGSDITTIQYLDSYDPDQKGNQWYAIRIWPVGRPDILPGEDDYLHDISYTGLTVYDPDPCAHAWHTAKGDPSNEETHGFDIHCCKGVSVTDCQFITVGDEAIDICFCHDVVVMNNRLVGSPGAGPGGGAISIGDGCKSVVVCGNTVNGCAPDETLADGTIIKKSNYGIALESLEYPVQDVTVIGNTIRNMHGKGINLGATGGNASITNVVIADNVIRGCDLGIRLAGTLPKDNIKIANNLICDCLEQAIWAGSVGNLTICGNTIRHIKGTYAIHTSTMNTESRQFIADNVLEGIAYGGVYCSGNVVLKDCVFNGLGTAETAPTTNTYGVYKLGGVLTISGCVFKDVRMSSLKSCLQDVDYIDNTDVEVVNKTTGIVDGGGSSVAGAATKRIAGCSLIGHLDLKQDNTIVQSTKIVYTGSAHAVTVAANRVLITGCVIENNSSSSSYKAINETSGYNYNLFANNIVNRTITTTGAQSVAVNNIDTRATA